MQPRHKILDYFDLFFNEIIFFMQQTGLQQNYSKIIYIVFTSILNVFKIISITYIIVILIIPYFTIS